MHWIPMERLRKYLKFWLFVQYLYIWFSPLTGNLIAMLRLLKNKTFSTASRRPSHIIQNVRIIFETLDTRLMEALCDVNTEGK